MSQQSRVSGVKTVIGYDDGFNYVQYHATKVVKWSPSQIILKTGGWYTSTTKTRMNQASNQFQLGYRVFAKDYNWFVRYQEKDIPFEENMVLAR